MILHHFDASPFSEKVRIALGIKGVSWRSVKVPRILPKPNLMPLTGGYRRTPVAQIGRDIYADTRLILAELEARHATPALYPPKQAASIAALEQLGDQVLFLAAIPLLLSEPGRVALENALGAAGLAAFRADRAALFDQGRIGAPTPDFSAAHWHPSMAALEAQLQDRAYLLGDVPTAADCAIYHPVWYVRGNPGVAEAVTRYPRVSAWADRMRAIGHATAEEISGADALAQAAAADDFEPLTATIDPDSGLTMNQSVHVAATDYGADSVAGRLVHLSQRRIVIERDARDLGVLRNHFPRAGFSVTPGDGADVPASVY